MRRVGILMVLTLSFAAVGGSSAAPNVVIFYADDMGIGDIGAYGCTDIRTPAIDGLAARGVRFENYYSAAPICSPSRAALLTGRYPIRAGVPTNVGSTPGSPGMPTEQVTIAEVARTRGYATGAIGKWHLGFIHDQQPNSQGFDYFFGHHAGCIDFFSHTFYWDGRAPNHHDLYRNREEIHEEGEYLTHLITREATAFIDRNVDQRFLLYVPYNAPHYPMHAPKRYVAMYKHLEKKRQLYASLVAAMDESIGQIISHVERCGLSANTLVFFMSDNGISQETRANGGGGSSGPFRESKFSLFEGGIRMPGIVVWPGHVPAGETRGQLSCSIDVLPTVSEAIGATLPEGYRVDGQSWLPLLGDAGKPGHDALFWSWGGQDAVRQGPWKLVRSGLLTLGMSNQERAVGRDSLFLSNVESDPGETTNLAGEHQSIAKRMMARHKEWLVDVSSAN